MSDYVRGDMINLIRRLRTDFTSVVLGRIEGIVCKEIAPRPMYRIHDVSTGAAVFLKLSRMPEPILALQLRSVSLLKNSCGFIPESFGYCADSSGRLFEVWEWIHESNESRVDLVDQAFHVLRNRFFAFVELASRLETCPSGTSFPNELQLVCRSLFRGGQIARLIENRTVSSSARNTLVRALDVWERQGFLEDLSSLPRSLVHSDIRTENLRSDFLVDYSNSKVDARLIELTRFTILNFEHTAEIEELMRSPAKLFERTPLALTSQESHMLAEVAVVDFACVFSWAFQQVREHSVRHAWAHRFLIEGPTHFEVSFSKWF